MIKRFSHAVIRLGVVQVMTEGKLPAKYFWHLDPETDNVEYLLRDEDK